jgi:adenylosuccinate lyase
MLETVARTAFEQCLPFREVLFQSGDVRQFLSIEEIEQALDPARYLGATGIFIANVLANEEKF